MASSWERVSGRENDLQYVELPEYMRKQLLKICRFWSMGYSEYEHEKTLQSIGNILTGVRNFSGFKRKFKGHQLYIISHWMDVDKIRDDLLYHYNHPHGRLKGWIAFKDSLENEGPLYQAKGWWSYTNNYLVFRDEKMFLEFCDFFGVNQDD